MVKGKKVGVISLGCDKNRVDTEKMLAVLSDRHVLTDDLSEAEIVIVNTCAFLSSARKEAIEEVLSVAENKKEGKLEKIIVTGCLPQKFTDEVFSGLKEADVILGTSDYESINEAIDKAYEEKERLNLVGKNGKDCGEKRVLTTDGYAYLKIAEGCSNHCTYCLIPSIRGKYRSFPKEKLVEEAKNLGEINELILVAQDVTKYGEDLTPKSSLCDLIRALSPLHNIKGIRLLYCYPENVSDDLIREIRDNPKIIKYIDIPLQHADDRILKLMNRKGSGEEYIKLIEKLKREVPEIAIRSTFITGFPTEDDKAFENLLTFIKRAKLFNAGFFKYSREEGTPAYKLDGQVKESVKTARVKKLYSAQKKVVREILKSFKGKTLSVRAEGFDENLSTYYGRAYFNAPDIDGKVYFFSDDEVKNGELYKIKVLSYTGYDLYGQRVDE